MAERITVNKPRAFFAKQLRDVAGKVVGKTFVQQGFGSAELVTRWTDIIGADIAAHSEPIKIQWARAVPHHSSPRGEGSAGMQEPGTLLLRVEGPAAIEIQHLTNVICDRVNQFLGWRAVARVRLQQAPLRRGERKKARGPDPVAAARIAATLPEIADEDLKQALARLGAAVKNGAAVKKS
jgi:hypothetical protein